MVWQCGHLFNGCFGDGVLKSQASRVKSDPACAEVFGLRTKVGGSAVQRVTDDRVVAATALQSDLVGAAGVKFDFQMS